MPWNPISLYSQIDQLRRSLTQRVSRGTTEYILRRTDPVVESELILEEMDASFVDLLSSISLILLSRVYGAPFSVPHTQSTLIQPLSLPLVCPDDSLELVTAAGVLLW